MIIDFVVRQDGELTDEKKDFLEQMENDVTAGSFKISVNTVKSRPPCCLFLLPNLPKVTKSLKSYQISPKLPDKSTSLDLYQTSPFG